MSKMEFSFDINNLFGPEISKLDAKLTPYRSCPGSRQYKEQLHQVIDEMGEASAKAQGLRGAITSADRMKHTDQILYVMKEPGGNSKLGCAVGILKVGTKKLFVYDSNGVQHEMEPLCVLDFYVHESRQRRGYGRQLFDFMLQDQSIKPQHLAIDKPSHKFSSFLQKHYHLKATIPQVNNFVIFNGFFQDRHKRGARVSGRKAPLLLYESQRSKNNENERSLQGFGTHQQKEALQKVSARQNITGEGSDRPGSGKSASSGGDAANNHLGGMQALYSRHDLNPVSPLPDIGQSKSSSANSLYGRKGPSPLPLHNPSAYQDRRGHLKVSPVTSSGNNQSNRSGHDPGTGELSHRGPSHGNQSQSATQSSGKYMYSNGHPAHSGAANASNHRGAYDIQRHLDVKTLANHIPPAGTTPNNPNDVLLPKNFIPYSNLKLPEPDPYSRRVLSTRAADTNLHIFGVTNIQPATGYASPQRFKNTRPW